jgi:RNA polymerase sigma-70 factor (ECF subfamily)
METSTSLLDRLKGADGEAWGRFVDSYTPLIRSWLERQGTSSADADDVAQEVMAVVLRRIAEFERARAGSFRAWLRAITVNQLRSFWKRGRRGGAGADLQAMADELADPGSRLSRCWDAEHDAHVMRWLLEAVRPRFRESTWAAFRGQVLEDRPPQEVATSLGMSLNAVLIAKSRVLAALREEGRGLVDEAGGPGP